MKINLLEKLNKAFGGEVTFEVIFSDKYVNQGMVAFKAGATPNDSNLEADSQEYMRWLVGWRVEQMRAEKAIERAIGGMVCLN